MSDELNAALMAAIFLIGLGGMPVAITVCIRIIERIDKRKGNINDHQIK